MAEYKPRPIRKYDMNIDALKAKPAINALFLLPAESIVVSSMIKTANAQGFIESRAAPDIIAGIVSFFVSLTCSSVLTNELSPIMLSDSIFSLT